MAQKPFTQIIRRSSGEVLVASARWCHSYFSRLRGLQFRRSLAPGETLILAKDKDSASASSIHMLFVFFPIAAIWVNRQGRVTSAQLAKPWHPYYASPEPACCVIEASPELLERIQVGEFVDFIHPG